SVISVSIRKNKVCSSHGIEHHQRSITTGSSRSIGATGGPEKTVLADNSFETSVGDSRVCEYHLRIGEHVAGNAIYLHMDLRTAKTAPAAWLIVVTIAAHPHVIVRVDGKGAGELSRHSHVVDDAFILRIQHTPESATN